MTLVHGGGITHVRRLADFASLYAVRTGFHGATDLSPVTMGAALHFDYWVPNFGIQEHMAHSEQMESAVSRAYEFDDGYFTPGETPGHGVRIDGARGARSPRQPARVPVQRVEQRTVRHS